MKHLVIVLSIILFVSLTFLHPSIIEDASFNDYDYLQKLRRSHENVTIDNKDKGWQEDGTFKSWYQKGNGSENDKYLNNITPTPTTPDSIDSKIEWPNITNIRLNQPMNHVDSNKSTVTQNKVETDSSNTTNVLPYALLLLLIIIISIIVYIKYK